VVTARRLPLGVLTAVPLAFTAAFTATRLEGTGVLDVWRIEAVVLIVAAVLDTALRDIHGLPFLAGLVTAAVWVRRGSVGIARTPA